MFRGKTLGAISIFTYIFMALVAQATPVADYPLFVPLESIHPPATDLYYDNRILFPNEARKLRDQGIDLSQIDPDPTTDLWSPNSKGSSTDTSPNAISVQNGAHTRYLELVDTPVKIFRFNVLYKENDGTERLYTVLVGKRVHTFLLRKALLEKLGYKIPAMKRMAKLTVEFSSSLAKEDFVENKMTGLRWHADGAEQWISNLDDKNSRELIFHDVIISHSDDAITNLAFGYIRSDFTRGRRLINALIVPYNLVDVRESINGFRWHSATLRNNAIYMPLEDIEEFATPIEDARWIARRLQSLTRQDFVDIVAAAEYPEAPAKLLVEKLIARRNNLMKLLNIEGDPIPYNSTISYGTELVNGELIKGDYDGFGARLAMGEEESPVSPKEIKALFISKGISTIIDELIARANIEIKMGPDLAAKAYKEQREAFLKALLDSVKTGQPFDIKFKAWTAPFYGVNLIASREVVSGSYLGTDNRIQLVDNFGASASLGLYIGTVGLKPGQFLDGRVALFYARQYSHLRPLNSIESALDEPYKNILVPLVKKEIGRVIPGSLQDDFDQLPKEEQIKKAQEIAQLFKDELGEGESIIISDSIGNLEAVRFGLGLTDEISTSASLNGNLLHLSRLHILRVGDNLHVYKDRGNLTSLELVVSIRADIEILSIRGSLTKGTARTDFYRLNISNDLNSNPDLLLNLSAIRQILIDGKLNRLKAIRKPHTLEHAFTEKQGEFNFLIWNKFKLKATDRIKVLRAEEDSPDYYIRHYSGERSGNDYQSMTVDTLNYLLQEATGEPIAISNSISGDPGDTLFGKSNSRYSYFEAEVDRSGSYERFGEQFVGIIYRWRGWSAKRKDIEKRVNEFSKRYNFQFFNNHAFSLIEKAQLYTLALRIYIYQPGIDHLLALDNKTIKDIFNKYHTLPKTPVGGPPKHQGPKRTPVESAIISYQIYRKDYDKALEKGQTNKAGEKLTKMISILEASLSKDGLLLALGGEKNVLITSDLMGFLKGEDGSFAKLPVEGHQIGQVASARPAGPLSAVQTELGMTESEFFVNWLLRKL